MIDAERARQLATDAETELGLLLREADAQIEACARKGGTETVLFVKKHQYLYPLRSRLLQRGFGVQNVHEGYTDPTFGSFSAMLTVMW